MLNTTKYKKNATQKYSEVLPHTGQNDHHQKVYNNKCWREFRENGILLHCSWDCKLVLLLWSKVWRFLKKLKNRTTYNPAISLLGMYLEKTIIRKTTRTPVCTAALFSMAKPWEQPTCPSAEEWIKVAWCIYTSEYSAQFSCSVVPDSVRSHE